MLNYKNSVLAVLSSSQIVKLETTGNGDEGGFNAVTKPVVWVQITVKKYRVDDKNLLHLKYPTCQKLWMFFLSVLMKISFQKWFCLILQKLMTLKEKNLEKYGSWFSCLLIRKMSRELIVGSQVPLSLQQFYLTKLKPENVLYFRRYSMKALEALRSILWGVFPW